MNNPVIELVLIKLKPGVANDAFKAASTAIQPLLAKMPGYVRRELYQNADGQWVDLVWWTSMDTALNAMTVLNAEPAMQPMAGMIDFAGTTLLHLDQVAHWG